MSKLIPTLCIILSFCLGWVARMNYESYTIPLIPESATVPPAQTQAPVEYKPLPEGAINDLR